LKNIFRNMPPPPRPTARDRALKILQRVDTTQAYTTQLLDQLARDQAIAQNDLALIYQLVKGTLAQRARIDAVLDDTVTHGIERLTPWIRNILRLGAYQLLYLDQIPPEAAVNESVNLAKIYGHPGTVKLVNAVLRKVAAQAGALRAAQGSPGTQDTPEQIAAAYSHPPWLVRRWFAQLGAEETIALCEANNRPWPPCARTNTLKIATPALRERLEAGRISWQPARYHPDCTLITGLPGDMRLHTLDAHREGLLQIQDESFAWVARLVDPQPGQSIVDLCSAPGGKTTYLAELMGNQGHILAVDIHTRRLAMVEDHCRRLGVSIAETRCVDGRLLQLDRPADAILVDAPCSGTGVLGRHSDARWNKSEDDLAGLQQLQLELLLHAASLVKAGGKLVYATCTLEPEENQGTVEAFLQRSPHYRRAPLPGIIPAELTGEDGFFRAWPHRHSMGGAFASVLIRDT
jgi:16S rRNA (cytosine967-C5)-methyltransferase